MEPVRLRPLQVGETLDAAIKIYRSRFGTLVAVVFIVVAPIQVLNTVIFLSLPDTTTTSDTASTGATVAVLAAAVLFYVGVQLATATSLKVISDAYLGQERPWIESLQFAFRRIKSLVWGALLFGAIFFVGWVPFIIPGIYFAVACSVFVPVLLLEDLRGAKALNRSRRLVEKRWWPVFGCMVLLVIMAFFVTMSLSTIASIFAAQAEDLTMFVIIQTLLAIGIYSVFTPFAAAVIAVIYFDLRVRKEGFDLELLARSLTPAPASNW